MKELPAPAAQDLDSEALVLSASLLSPDALAEALSFGLEPSDFFHRAHSLIWEAAVSLEGAGEAADLPGVLIWLKERDRDRQVGGSPYLAQLVETVPAGGSLERSTKRIRDLARLRRLSDALKVLAVNAGQAETTRDVDAFCDSAEAAIFAATSDGRRHDTGEHLGEGLAEDVKTLGQKEPEGGASERGLTTSLPQLDRLIIGLAPGTLTLVAARPGMGKTALATQILVGGVERSGGAGLYFTMEMSRVEIRRRILSQRSGVPGRSIRLRTIEPEDWSKITGTVRDLAALPIRLDDCEDLSPARLRSLTRRHLGAIRRKFGERSVSLIVVDYIQLMDADAKSESREQELSEISRSLKRLAKANDCAVVACCQLNRALASRKDKTPSLSDLRGSGALEQDADNVLFVHRDDAYEPNAKKHDGKGELILAKGRGVGTGTAFADFDSWCARFKPEEPPEADRTYLDD